MSDGFDVNLQKFYRQSLTLYQSQNEDLVIAGQRDSGFQLWELQTRILASQFGLFGGDSRIQRQARLSFTKLHVVCVFGFGRGLDCLKMHLLIRRSLAGKLLWKLQKWL
jgi:hypothetical protein